MPNYLEFKLLQALRLLLFLAAVKNGPGRDGSPGHSRRPAAFSEQRVMPQVSQHPRAPLLTTEG
jgi:hypothetical protein